MWRRHAQILGLLLCTLGWGFVGCTLAMEDWRVAQLGGQGGSSVVVTARFWSDLWKDCYEDSTAVVNCVDFGVLRALKPYIQAVRGLLLIGLLLGVSATVLTFFGVECTRLGGDTRSKDRMLITASSLHLFGCASDLAAYCLYTNSVVEAFLHTKADPSKLRYEMGPPLYLGMAACFLVLLGCTLHCATSCRVIYTESKHPVNPFLSEEREEKYIFRRYQHTSSYKLSSAVTV